MDNQSGPVWEVRLETARSVVSAKINCFDLHQNMERKSLVNCSSHTVESHVTYEEFAAQSIVRTD